ncbi:PepSY domain-containing protein [Bacillus sp. CGMCC 1.16541]|uniref:PepSY domain-containing protein n=1 Tax=Bacillus sp. CGMCC 1.16541 TaxID=2185143 RepID=UPI000D726577|nr:PepSY domain-containing protein [Bacillus sp. CGMCC 1.16541]
MKKLIVTTAASALLIGGIGFGASAMKSDQQDDVKAYVQQGEAKQKISVEQAKASALKAVPGTVKEVELDKKDGRLVYEVEVKHNGDDKDVYVDAYTGKVLNQFNDDNDDNKQVENQTQSSFITKEQAKQIALKQVKGTVEEVELDDEDGQNVYEVEIETNDDDVTVYVSAENGEVITIDWD